MRSERGVFRDALRLQVFKGGYCRRLGRQLRLEVGCLSGGIGDVIYAVNAGSFGDISVMRI